MNRILLLTLPLALACSQPEDVSAFLDAPQDAYEQLDESKPATPQAPQIKVAGAYRVVYDAQDGGAMEYYTLNEDGSCTWTYDGFSKNGSYTVNNENNELKILIIGNTGVIEELYNLNDKGQWRKANGYLEKIK